MLYKIIGRTFMGILLLFFIGGCGSMKPSDFSNGKPTFVLEEYFSGKTKAWGSVVDRFGTVKRQFTVDIEGSWNGKQLVLDEKFNFDDGEKSTRVWKIRKTGDNTYEGAADDVVGVAKGISSGNALNWKYILDLKIGDNSINVSFDDWMFLQSDGVLINRAKMTKLGLEMGIVNIFFKKL